MEDSEIELYLKKSSKWSSILLLVGLFAMVGALLFSAYKLNDLRNESSKLKAENDQLSSTNKELNNKNEELNQKNAELLQKNDNEQNNLNDKQNRAAALDIKIKELTLQLENTQTALKDSIERLPPNQAKELVTQLESNPSSKMVVEDLENKSVKTKDLKTAQAKELEGFKALVGGEYDNAIKAFQASENAYNSYHQVYELAQFLRRNKARLNDPAKKKEVFREIVKNFPYGAPPDLWQQVKAIAAQ